MNDTITNDQFDELFTNVKDRLKQVRKLVRYPYRVYIAVEGTNLEDDIEKLASSTDEVRKARLQKMMGQFGLRFDNVGMLTFVQRNRD